MGGKEQLLRATHPNKQQLIKHSLKNQTVRSHSSVTVTAFVGRYIVLEIIAIISIIVIS